ncbi:MAG: DsbA family protein [Actinomycetes bacterium]
MTQPRKRAEAGTPAAAGSQRPANRVVTVAALGLLALLIGVGLYQSLAGPAPAESAAQPGAAAAGAVVREDSHRLSTAPDGKVTLVEFLDFECESCRAVYPAIEQLRRQYAGRVTFVARYFPLESHFNAMRAARAVEAAAQQGKFEAMYAKMFTTQASWGEQQVPQDDLFRSYAVDLGLDMARWDADYASPATQARIQTDIDDGTALGVSGTPSFFLNGERITPQSYEDLTSALDAALAG